MAQNPQKLNQKREMGEIVDLKGLSEEQIKRVKELIKSLKKGGEKEREKIELKSWPLGIKGRITRKEIYD